MFAAGIISVVFLLVLASFRTVTGVVPDKDNRRLEGSDSTEWTYYQGEAGETPYGPSDWGEAFEQCYGAMQSPINLCGKHIVVKPAKKFDLKFYPMECSCNEMQFSAGDHAWSVDYEDCNDRSSLEFSGDHYQLVGVHVHSTSEHENGGATHDAEIHLVHLLEGTTDELLVVGVMLDVGFFGSNSPLTNLWTVLADGAEEAAKDCDWVSSPYDLLPATPEYSHYMGSLTTPPCTEGVRWIVMAGITMLSTDQIKTFRSAVGAYDKIDAMGNTNRPVQPLNNRKVTYVSAF